MFSNRPTLSKLLLLSGLLFLQAHAQTTNATCRADFDWMLNSRGQNPCLVAAYAESACDPAIHWNVTPVPNSTLTYAGPDGDLASPCTCSSVVFCLLSACAYCQGNGLPDWSDWTQSCPPDDISNGQFPSDTPDGTVIPTWAYQQVVNRFNVTVAEGIAENSRPTPTSSGPSVTNTSTTSATGKKNIAPIVGGVVGGAFAASLLAAVAVYILRHPARRTLERTEIEPPLHHDSEKLDEPRSNLPSSHPESSVHLPTLAAQPMRLYNPDDPSTYPPQDLTPVSFPEPHTMPYNVHHHSGQPSSLPQV